MRPVFLELSKRIKTRIIMLEKELLQQLAAQFASLDATYTLALTTGKAPIEGDDNFREFLTDLASASPKVQYTEAVGEGGTSFALLRNGEATGVVFRGIPGGHEFISLLRAIFNADGKGQNFPDEALLSRIKALKGPIALTTYMSLDCTNCPDVVQALNIVALYNPHVTHTIVDGALHEDEVNALHIQGVPTVVADGKTLHVGRGGLGELLGKLEEKYGSAPIDTAPQHHEFDVLVVGGGPGGVAAAVYSARKGLNVGIVSENIGGQVKETVGIENLISVPKTTGSELASALRTHAADYPIGIFENRRVESTDLSGSSKTLTATGGETFSAPQVIIATGAKWRKLGVPGEADYIGKGVAFCPHCDGPLFKDKHVAVIGGGNSGIEAAIDLAGICSKITVVEFLDELKADSVLQDKLRSLPNVTVLTSTQTTEVVGNGTRVTALTLKDRKTEQTSTLELDGVFVQIGLVPSTEAFREQLETNRIGEIIIDDHNRASLPGVYAAGDCSSVPYNQIIISMGEGAKAALAAFEDRMRGGVA